MMTMTATMKLPSVSQAPPSTTAPHRRLLAGWLAGSLGGRPFCRWRDVRYVAASCAHSTHAHTHTYQGRACSAPDQQQLPRPKAQGLPTKNGPRTKVNFAEDPGPLVCRAAWAHASSKHHGAPGFLDLLDTVGHLRVRVCVCVWEVCVRDSDADCARGHGRGTPPRTATFDF